MPDEVRLRRVGTDEARPTRSIGHEGIGTSC